MAYIRIGEAVNTHGLKGELKIQSWSDFDDVRYQKGNTVYLEQDGNYLPVKVATYRKHKGFSLVSFVGLQDINLIEQYKGAYIAIDKAQRHALPEGEFYMDELNGMQVFDEDNHFIGTVLSVEPTNGAQNNIRVQRENQPDALIPHIPFFVKQIDREKKQIIIHVENGLL